MCSLLVARQSEPPGEIFVKYFHGFFLFWLSGHFCGMCISPHDYTSPHWAAFFSESISIFVSPSFFRLRYAWLPH